MRWRFSPAVGSPYLRPKSYRSAHLLGQLAIGTSCRFPLHSFVPLPFGLPFALFSLPFVIRLKLHSVEGMSALRPAARTDRSRTRSPFSPLLQAPPCAHRLSFDLDLLTVALCTLRNVSTGHSNDSPRPRTLSLFSSPHTDFPGSRRVPISCYTHLLHIAGHAWLEGGLYGMR